MGNVPLQTLRMVPDGVSRFGNGIQIGSSQIQTIRDEHGALRDIAAVVAGKAPDRIALPDLNALISTLQTRAALSLEVRLHATYEALDVLMRTHTKAAAGDAALWVLSLSDPAVESDGL